MDEHSSPQATPMDKKFAIQFVLILVVIFLGLFSVFQPQVLGLPNIVPGGLPTGMTNTTNQNIGVGQILFIDQASTGDPELVKAILKVDVAETPQARAQGLSNRESMDPDQGMIFLFPQADKYNFIMKQMKFPLDFIWVRDNQIIDILENVQPDPPGTSDADLKRYAPVAEVDKVIEVNSGYVSKYGLKVGDRIRLEALPAASVY